jgi:RimJ/RimL family protein N-acetyltransferase
MTPLLQTERLYLRHFTIEDASLIFNLNTSTVIKYIHEEPVTDLPEAERIIKEIILPQYERYQLGRFAVHVKNDNRFIGWCGLKFLQPENEVDLGYRFMEKEWGKGFATEAAKVCLQFGFEERNLQKIDGKSHTSNIASQKVLQKTGMIFEKETFENQEPIRVYSITREQYRQKKEGY